MADAVTVAPVIHAVWSADSSLVALVPASRFITGEVQQEGMARPYVTVNFDQSKETETNSCRADRGTAFFDVYSDSETTADTIARTIVEAFVTDNDGRHASGSVTCDFSNASAPQREQTGMDRWHLQLTVQFIAQANF